MIQNQSSTIELMSTIMNSIPQGMLFIDLQGIVAIYNPIAEELLAVASQKVLSLPFWHNFPDDFFGFSLKEALRTALFPPIAGFSATTIKGNIAELEFTFSAAYDQQGACRNFMGITVLMRDVSQIRQLQLMAMRHNRMHELGEMAAMVAHEIRNPLGGIKGFASLLERDLTDQPNLKEMANYIIQGTNSLDRLVTRVLHYARPIQLQLHPTDILALINELVGHVKADIGLSRKSDIATFFPASSIMLLIDPLFIRAALLNLIVNGLQAMPQGGRLSISVTTTEDQALIAIADMGIGIPEENLEKIFSPFFTTKSEGSGFGLSETHKNIQVHGGAITVASKVGMGTTFTIFLPFGHHGECDGRSPVIACQTLILPSGSKISSQTI